MNLSNRNICVVLLAAVLGIYLLAPKADAAGQCAGSMCLHCSGMLFSVNVSATKVGIDNHMCDIAFGNSPCNLDKNSNANATVVIVPAKNSDRQGIGASFGFAGYNPSLFQNEGKNDKAPQFLFRSGTIPLYLQNLSFLC
jgi:hypothetical protein